MDTVKIGKTADELLAERVDLARAVFTPTQIHNWELNARLDADANQYSPPTAEELLLGESVYLQAYNRRRYKIAKAKRTDGSGDDSEPKP